MNVCTLIEAQTRRDSRVELAFVAEDDHGLSVRQGVDAHRRTVTAGCLVIILGDFALPREFWSLDVEGVWEFYWLVIRDIGWSIAGEDQEAY
jgi:hypothetical protein